MSGLIEGAKADKQTFNPIRIDEDDILVTTKKKFTDKDITDGTAIYERYWSGSGDGIIYKLYLHDSTIWSWVWASGAWADRTTLTYVPVDQELT